MFSANSSQVSNDKLFVEDVFSTTVYSGTGGFRAINVGISNFAVEGGMVWMKARNSGAFGNEIHRLYDTARAGGGGGGTLVCAPSLQSNSASQDNSGTSVTFYPTNTVITTGGGNPNSSGYNYAAWAFRKAPKFFDVVTYTGNGAANNVAHSLGVKPGFIIIKRTDASANWMAAGLRANGNYATFSNGTTGLNSDEAASPADYNPSGLTSTSIDVSSFESGTGNCNASGGTYVAYLFAHNAGGFGNSGTDSIISCGSFTTDGNGVANVTLGWEPQFVITKRVNGAQSWQIADVMRGQDNAGTNLLYANLDNAEFRTSSLLPCPNATGFSSNSGSFFANSTYIYIAIRRPMKTPTLGTSVYSTVAASSRVATFSNRPDLVLFRQSLTIDAPNEWVDRLRGGKVLNSTSTGAEYDATGTYSITLNNSTAVFGSSWVNTPWNTAFTRAPGFFDEVCYTGTGAAGRTVNHNLGVAPELMIVKRRNAVLNWVVYNNSIGNSNFLVLNLNNAVSGATYWNNTDPTSTQFTLGGSSATNFSGGTYVAYLFASAPGVSKVGSYTGNGSSQTINCGFAAGARFVMIKRTDSTGDWYVWDTARGIVAGNDPHLSLNSIAAEVTTDDTINTASSGFVVDQVSATNVNVNAATYIYLAIA